jgi:hypothetical protein
MLNAKPNNNRKSVLEVKKAELGTGAAFLQAGAASSVGVTG